MQWNHFDFTEYLIMQEKLGFHISNDVMLEDFKSKIPKSISSKKMLDEKTKSIKLPESDSCQMSNSTDKYKTNSKNTVAGAIYTKSFNQNISNGRVLNKLEKKDDTSPLFPHLPRSDPKYLSKRLQCLQIGGLYQKQQQQQQQQITTASSLSSTQYSSITAAPAVENQQPPQPNHFEQKQHEVMMPRVPSSSRSALLSNNPFNVQSRLVSFLLIEQLIHDTKYNTYEMYLLFVDKI